MRRSGSHPDTSPTRPTLSDDVISAYLRARGVGSPTMGLVAGARERALRRRHGPRRLARVLGLVTAMAVFLGLGLVVDGPTGPHPVPTVPGAGGRVAPVRELVSATYRDTPTGSDVWLRPADPATARPLDGFDPIIVTQPFEPHLSPDGRTLAIMTWLSDAPGTGTLRLIDLASWTIADTPVTGLVDFRGVTWTPDSRSLVWLAPTETSITLPIGHAFEVMRWSIGAPSAEHLVTLPDPALRPLHARIMDGRDDPTASTLVVIGRLLDEAGQEGRAVHILTVDLDQPAVVDDVELSDLELGLAQRSPAVMWDLPRRRVFVASHDRLLVVGLPGLEVAAVPVDWATSADDIPPEAFLSGALSLDGARLYLTGLTAILTGDPDQIVRYGPIGLRVIDTRDGSRVGDVDASIGQLALSPTGERLLVVSWDPGDEVSSRGPSGEVRLLDPATLEVVARIPPVAGTVPLYPASLDISWDGRYAYVMTTVDHPVGDRGDQGTIEPRAQVIDLVDGIPVAETAAGSEESLVELFALGGS